MQANTFLSGLTVTALILKVEVITCVVILLWMIKAIVWLFEEMARNGNV